MKRCIRFLVGVESMTTGGSATLTMPLYTPFQVWSLESGDWRLDPDHHIWPPATWDDIALSVIKSLNFAGRVRICNATLPICPTREYLVQGCIRLRRSGELTASRERRDCTWY